MKNVYTFNNLFKPLGSYGISTNDRKILLSTGWGGCNPKASGS